MRRVTCKMVADSLQTKLDALSDAELTIFAEDMGVSTQDLSRKEIEIECIALEQYAFTN